MNPDEIIGKMKERYTAEETNDVDGLKIDFEHGWVHLRKSNTEPIIRIYTESESAASANELAQRIEQEIESLI